MTAIAATVSPLALAAGGTARADNGSRFHFKETAAGVDANHHVADGYDADVLIRRGDPVLSGAPAFDPMRQSAAAQKRQFGYNNDFFGYIPMPGATDPSRHGLLVVNHEYTNEELMFPGIGRQDSQDPRGAPKDAAFARMTPELAAIEMAAHGGSVMEIWREGDKWSLVGGSNTPAGSTRTRRWKFQDRRPVTNACGRPTTQPAGVCSACSTIALAA